MRATFREIPLDAYQAPVKTSPSIPHIQNPPTFGHILRNKGYRDVEELGAMTEAWRQLFDFIRPDLLLFDHAPTALLAARGLNVPQATIGTGFFCPPDESPLANMSSIRDMPLAQREKDEFELVQTINAVLAEHRQPELSHLGRLFHDVDDNLFCTFQELDHYPQRVAATYYGCWSADLPREEFTNWPTGTGKRIFAYLKPMKGLGELIRWLYGQKHPTILVGDRIDFTPYREWGGGSVRFVTRPLQLERIRQEADVAIMNGNHGAACEFLLAGVPTLQLPITYEQGILTRRILETGAAMFASPENGRQMIGQLSSLLASDEKRNRAKAFAAKYRQFSPEIGIERLCSRLSEMLG
ncbi:hypothetical protein LOC68_01590 [Blastopirellula sp. JC732]|uniref:Uncharacterized protein n=1 Tax=Blastopirellula sediminis TaxID=2894196 RepID=A0A9X1SEU1_9BACT|nr:hypothetical protein [Blastopirellula sediminis]MCC9627087.1 hypothetical protein [Blastopirellula sediminis]